MRSSKNRQRSKQNRPRTLGNIVNRVFDSSGPEGKVRGTPQQIIEKYLVLARDAQIGNDRVAAENFMQHAEHYTRMLGEAQREMVAEQDTRQGQGGYRREDGEGWTGNGERREVQGGGWRDQPGGERRDFDRGERQPRESQPGGERRDFDRGERQPREGQPGGERRDFDRGERHPREGQPREGQPREGQPGGERRDFDRGERQPREGQPWREGGERRDNGERRDGGRRDFRNERPESRPAVPADVVDLADDPRDTGLVETPEARVVAAPMMPAMPVPDPAAEAEGERKPPRRARGPRKPREDDAPQGEAPAVAD